MQMKAVFGALLSSAFPCTKWFQGRLKAMKGELQLVSGLRDYLMARALFSAASIISRSPGPLSLMPQRWRMP